MPFSMLLQIRPHHLVRKCSREPLIPQRSHLVFWKA